MHLSFFDSITDSLLLLLPLFRHISIFETVAVVEKSGKYAPLKDMEKMKPLMQMVFHCIDKMKRMKLTKEVNCYLLLKLINHSQSNI